LKAKAEFESNKTLILFDWIATCFSHWRKPIRNCITYIPRWK